MPKLKTNKGAAKRFRFTKKGKIKFGHAFAGHLLSCKSRKRKRRLRKATFVGHTEAHKFRSMLPYGA